MTTQAAASVAVKLEVLVARELPTRNLREQGSYLLHAATFIYTIGQTCMGCHQPVRHAPGGEGVHMGCGREVQVGRCLTAGRGPAGRAAIAGSPAAIWQYRCRC